MGNYYVYKHTAPTEKIYIGITRQTPEKRFGSNGCGYKKCPAFYNAIKKYGWVNIKHEILFEGLTKEEAERKEIELIKKYKSNHKEYGYNIQNGGNTTGTHSIETRLKISEKNKGKIVSEEARRKRAETIRKNGGICGERNPFFGKHHTEETKKNHSEFMKGNKYNKGKHHTEEFKQMKSIQMHEKYRDGKSPRCKAVLKLNDRGEIISKFNSLTQASIAEKVCKATMCQRINNKNNKEWKYE